MLTVTYFYRAPRKTGLSIEGIFKLVSDCLRSDITIKEFHCEAALSRQKNTVNAAAHTGDINHITGDVNYLAMGFKSGKTVLTMHDFGHYENLKKKSWLRFIVFKMFWFRFPLKRVDIVTVVSEYTKKKLIEYLGFPESRIRVIHDPIKPIFRFTPRAQAGNPPHILQIGTGPHKNLKNLVAAARGTNWHLDIVAYPNDAELEMLKEAGIAYTVYNNLTDEEIYQRYVACDVLFFASFHEGFGMPIIEAQAIGRPVITSNFGAMLEVAGDTALLVNPEKPNEIKAAIEKLLAELKLYDHYVKAGQQNIVPYRHDVIARQYLEVYRELKP